VIAYAALVRPWLLNWRESGGAYEALAGR
jgi:hypothetical protein